MITAMRVMLVAFACAHLASWLSWRMVHSLRAGVASTAGVEHARTLHPARFWAAIAAHALLAAACVAALFKAVLSLH